LARTDERGRMTALLVEVGGYYSNIGGLLDDLRSLLERGGHQEEATARPSERPAERRVSDGRRCG
jgi:hypothetical protein